MREDRLEDSADVAGPWGSVPRWLPPIVILGALGVGSLAFGALFAPKTLLASGQQMNDAARVWAQYAAAYSAALCIFMLFLLSIRARRLLALVLIQAALTEVLLAVVAVANQRWEQIPPDVLLIALFLGCGSVLFGRPLWPLSAWRNEAGS